MIIFKLAPIVISLLTLVLILSDKNSNNAIHARTQYIGAAESPPCVNDYMELPVYRLIVDEPSGIIGKGSVYLIAKDLWISADHVVPLDNSINTVNLGNGETTKIVVDTRIPDIDLILLRGNSNDIKPINFSMKSVNDSNLSNTKFWNIGYPTFASGEKLLTSGSLEAYTDEYIFFKMLVMDGMSGGLTMMCDANNDPLAVGTIASFAYENLSDKEYTNEDGKRIREVVKVNTGESFSAPVFHLTPRIMELLN